MCSRELGNPVRAVMLFRDGRPMDLGLLFQNRSYHNVPWNRGVATARNEKSFLSGFEAAAAVAADRGLGTGLVTCLIRLSKAFLHHSWPA